MSIQGKSKYQKLIQMGDIFGRWTVIGEVFVEHEAKIGCRCECGNVRNVSCYTLFKGTSRQCLDCGNCMIGNENPVWKGYEEIPGKFLGRMKYGAKKRGINFNLTPKYLWNLFLWQNRLCALTGIPLTISTKECDNTASVDRIDSSRAYEEANVQWVHKDVNRMKNEYSQEYFIRTCKLIAENNDCN